MKHDTSRLRKAAQFYEREWGATSHRYQAYYPCFAVQQFDPKRGSYAIDGSLANRFIKAMCPGRTPPTNGFDASDRYLTRVNLDTEAGRDHCITALCFAAAMAEAGDL